MRQLLFDQAGVLWIGTEHGGAARYEAGRFIGIHEVNGVPFTAVFSLAEDRDGVVWINASGHLLALARDGRLPPLLHAVGHQPFDVMEVEDSTGAKWFRLLEGVARSAPALCAPAPAVTTSV